MPVLAHLPNALSLGRMLMIPLVIWSILHVNDGNLFRLLFIYLFTIFLDFLDGFLARHLALESEMGKILDPLADKLLVLAVLFTLTFKAQFPIWLAAFIILRDVIILTASLMLIRRKTGVKASIFVGKATFGLLSLLIFIYLIDLHGQIDLLLLKRILIVLSCTFLCWSTMEYYKIYQKVTHG